MADTNEWRPKANPWLITGAVMAATIMEVLDTSVANVALNHIAGNLSASVDNATWVLTSYLVSNAIIQPATGWFGQYFSRRNFLIACICIFTLASALCGLANSLGMLILARIVQGAGGGALQPISQAVLLDKGQDADWFSSTFIRVLATGAALGFIAFVCWELKTPKPIVNLPVLLDRNLAIGAALIFILGGILNGTTAILPQFLQNLMNYTALQAGLVISPRGLGAIAGTLLAGRLLSKLDGRAFMAQGAALLALSMYWLGYMNLLVAPGNLLWPIILSGFAVAAIFVPITTLSVATVSRQQMGDATGLTSLLRNLGGSVGISLLTNLVTRGTQAHQALMVGHRNRTEMLEFEIWQR